MCVTGSCIVIRELWHAHPCLLTHPALSIPRLVLALSVADLFLSVPYIFTTWAMPSHNGLFQSVGTFGTCALQHVGSLQLGVSTSPLYNLAMSFTALLMVRYKWRTHQILRVERLLHVIVIGYGLTATVPFFWYRMYNPTSTAFWIASYPHHCAECIRGAGAGRWRFWFAFFPTWPCLILATINMILIYLAVRQTEDRNLRWAMVAWSNSNNNTRQRPNPRANRHRRAAVVAIDENTQQNVPDDATPGQNAENSFGADFLDDKEEAVDDDESDNESETTETGARLPLSTMVQPNELLSSARSGLSLPTTPEEVISSMMLTPELRQQDSAHTRRLQEHRQSSFRQRSRAVAVQAIFYTCAFLLTFSLDTISLLWNVLTLRANDMLIVWAYMLFPLQGFFNGAVYARTAHMRTREGRLFQRIVFCWGPLYRYIIHIGGDQQQGKKEHVGDSHNDQRQQHEQQGGVPGIRMASEGRARDSSSSAAASSLSSSFRSMNQYQKENEKEHPKSGEEKVLSTQPNHPLDINDSHP